MDIEVIQLDEGRRGSEVNAHNEAAAYTDRDRNRESHSTSTYRDFGRWGAVQQIRVNPIPDETLGGAADDSANKFEAISNFPTIPPGSFTLFF